MTKSLTEISIRKPKQYRVLMAIAHAEHEGKPLQEVWKALEISESYGYSVKGRFRREIAEVKGTLATARDDPGSAVQAAKRYLKEHSVRAAEILVELTKQGSSENRRLAAQAVLDRAGIGETQAPTTPIREVMGALVTKIFYQKLPSGQEMLEISRLAKQSPQTTPSTLGPPGEEGVTSPQTPHPESGIPESRQITQGEESDNEDG